MPFIESFSINNEKLQPFPFNIPAVQFAKNIELNNTVTIFVSDNGTGKSTLLESIAYKLNFPLIGGSIKHHERVGFEASESIEPYLQINWKKETYRCFFFRAEDFSDFVNSVEKENKKIALDLIELKG